MIADNRSTDVFCQDDTGCREENGSVTFLTSPDGSLIAIKEVEFNRGDESLHIKGQTSADAIITIINADTNEILVEGLRAWAGKWEVDIENVGCALENITIMTSSGMQLSRRSKIVKSTMLIMTLSVRRVAGRPTLYIF